MKHTLPRPLRFSDQSRFALVLFCPILACVLFSILLMGIDLSAWAAELEEHADVLEDAQEAEANASRESVVEPSDDLASSNSLEDASMATAVDEEIPDDFMGATLFEHARRIDEAFEKQRTSLQVLVADLEAQKERFIPAVQDFENDFKAMNLRRAASDKAHASLADMKGRQSAVFQLLQSVRREILRVQGPDALEALACTSSLKEALERQELLERLAFAQAARLERLAREKKLLLAGSLLDAVEFAREREEIELRIQAINDLALAIESSCSDMRQSLKEFQDALLDADEAQTFGKGASAMKERISETFQSILECEDLVANWYESVDACAGVECAISFGTGFDFALPENEFVLKWSAAIDAFFDAQGAQLSLPLQGYGSAMAHASYQYKIDPRLCAAVSIVESSGGRFCIKPFNAWGWGAADGDPYGGAVEWSSFDEGIMKWHEGMASSSTGLASASCIGELAAIYCSSPHWGKMVSQLMHEIDLHHSA